MTAFPGTMDAMEEQMVRWLGTGEPNEIQSWYKKRNGPDYSGNFPWCNATITRAAVDSGNHDSVCFGTDYAYTPAHAERFRTMSKWTPMINGIVASGIRRGDIVFFDWDGSSSIGQIDHVGYVTKVVGSAVYTIEGNIGNVCARKIRYVHDIAGFGRPTYKPNPVPVTYTPFPGASWFTIGKKSPIVARMHKRLIQVGCNKYQSSTNQDTIGSGDVASYEAWQRMYNELRHKGWSGADLKWPPGKETWDALHVPTA
jgi:CHAP domain